MNITFSDDLLTTLKFNKQYAESSTPGSGRIYLPVSWWYHLILIGAGGGAGGGSYGSGHKSTGDGGGSGAGFIGDVFLTANTYDFTCGKGGNGGGNARRVPGTGHDGSSTALLLNGASIITAGGGAGGPAGRRSSSTTPEGSPIGRGGILTIQSGLQLANVLLSSNGNHGTANYGAPSLYGNYGKGGDGDYKGVGYPGSSGYIKVELI